MASLGLVFSQYPDDVIEFVTDPRTGVQRGKIFPPSIAEIVSACDARIADKARTARFKNWGKDVVAEIEGPKREDRLSYDELKAKYGENWGINPEPERAERPTFKAPNVDELRAHYARHDLAFRPKRDDAA